MCSLLLVIGLRKRQLLFDIEAPRRLVVLCPVSLAAKVSRLHRDDQEFESLTGHYE